MFPAESVDLVRARLLDLLAVDDRLSRRLVAQEVERSLSTVHKFIQGQSRSSALSWDLAVTFPELGEGLACPCCHKPIWTPGEYTLPPLPERLHNS